MEPVWVARLDVMVDFYDDGTPGLVAFCEAMPFFVGHGADDDEALDDWKEQYRARTLH